jgi:hypothetical protein
MREPPADFVLKLKAQCGSDWDVRFNVEVGRWEFQSISAGGMRVSQFFGWFYNPLTLERIEPDPNTGLAPFRDITDINTQDEILKNLEQSYIGNREDGARDWETLSGNRMRYNGAVDADRRQKRGADFAYLMKQMEIKRQWLPENYMAKRNQGKRTA